MFSWLDYHMFLFEVGERRFRHHMFRIEGELATDFRLADMGLKVGQRFAYTYDFGDDWRHTIKVESFLPMPVQYSDDWTPRILDGRRQDLPKTSEVLRATR